MRCVRVCLGAVMAVSVLRGAEVCCGAGAAPNTLTAAEQREGWRLLWDGRTPEGWQRRNGAAFPEKGWEIADGVLTVLPKNAGGGAGDIITRETFSSFILKVDFRLTDAANSGIKYFFDPALHGGTAPEYQVLDAKHPDAAKGRDGNRTVASLYDVLPAAGAKPKPVGEWNTAMIVCRGRQVEHWLNGEKVLAFERGSEAFRQAVARSKFSKHPQWGEQSAGRILLQDHQDRVSYRNLKIRVLPDERAL
ncbi:MAG: DUF1080 domain-containing protein [Kiritimatiellia bacterium]|nr:DUF1080 domain-containing protein [Kiritimatiellia bacterium]